MTIKYTEVTIIINIKEENIFGPMIRYFGYETGINDNDTIILAFDDRTVCDTRDEYKDLKYNFGICDMILKQKIPEPFQMFYTFIKEHYINNYDKLLTFIQSRKTDEPTNQIVSIYSMNTHIDYFALENKLIQTKLFIDSQK